MMGFIMVPLLIHTYTHACMHTKWQMFQVDGPYCAVPILPENVLIQCFSINIHANHMGKRFSFSSRCELGLSSVFLIGSPVTSMQLIHEPHCAAHFSTHKYLHTPLRIRMKAIMADKALHGLSVCHSAVPSSHYALPCPPKSTSIRLYSILSTSQALLTSGPLHVLPLLSGMLFSPPFTWINSGLRSDITSGQPPWPP